MGNQDIYSKFNNDKHLPINIELNKVCYFPEETITGTITLCPTLEVFDPLTNNPELIIILDEFQCYTYTTGSGKKKQVHHAYKRYNLIDTKLNFKEHMPTGHSPEIKIPFSVNIPRLSYPTLLLNENDFVRHYFTIDLPQCNAKRTKVIIIRNVFPTKDLYKNIEVKKDFSKSKFLSNKGSLSVQVKMAKNFFCYDELVPFEMNIDCSNLDPKLKLKSVKALLVRRKRKNYCSELSKERYYKQREIYTKDIDLDKGLTNHTISDFINYPTAIRYPPKIYEEFEEHGLYEVNDKKLNVKLYPSCREGLLSCEYFLKFRFLFDTILTNKEKLKIPIFFSENNELNLSLKNPVFNLSTYNYEDEDDSDKEENGIENTANTVNPE